ncbi:hypothetical protein MATL_G00123430 [Megalops atlanticus]|uniref:Uncharacterized protein n=1 Tax=Megalops atlanticus TaxID=7932 RepID=A0A9D3T5Y4_MEGAT|nr:hypothetical protein MATL_G00123430 [Megalops atlanticus]
MTAYLNKQPSCCRDAESRSMELALGEGPCACMWRHAPHAPHAYGYASHTLPSSSGATLPRQRSRLTTSRSEGTWRSPGRAAPRARGGSCDWWSDCGCNHGAWQDPYQVNRAPRGWPGRCPSFRGGLDGYRC